MSLSQGFRSKIPSWTVKSPSCLLKGFRNRMMQQDLLQQQGTRLPWWHRCHLCPGHGNIAVTFPFSILNCETKSSRQDFQSWARKLTSQIPQTQHANWGFSLYQHFWELTPSFSKLFGEIKTFYFSNFSNFLRSHLSSEPKNMKNDKLPPWNAKGLFVRIYVCLMR